MMEELRPDPSQKIPVWEGLLGVVAIVSVLLFALAMFTIPAFADSNYDLYVAAGWLALCGFLVLRDRQRERKPFREWLKNRSTSEDAEEDTNALEAPTIIDNDEWGTKP